MNKTIVIASVALALSASVGLAQAQTPPSPPTPAPRAGPPPAGPGGDFVPRFERGRGGPGRDGGWRMHRPRLTPEERRKRNADAFARMDANKDGQVTFEEFRQDTERRRLERQRQMFQRFTGGKDSFTLDQLNTQSARGFEGRGRGGRGFDGPPLGSSQGAPPAR